MQKAKVLKEQLRRGHLIPEGIKYKKQTLTVYYLKLPWWKTKNACMLTGGRMNSSEETITDRVFQPHHDLTY